MKKLLRYLVNTILFVVIWLAVFLPVVYYSFENIRLGPSGPIAIGGIIAIFTSYKLVKRINKSNLWASLFDETEDINDAVKGYKEKFNLKLLFLIYPIVFILSQLFFFLAQSYFWFDYRIEEIFDGDPFYDMGGAIFIPAIILHIILFILLKYYSINLKKKDKKNNISDLSYNLTKLGELKEKGLLTEDEFEEQKKKLLKQ